MQALAAVQARAQLQRQMLAQQQALLASVPTVAPPAAALVAAAAAGGATLAAGPAVDSTTARKSREVYIGNLSIGSVTPDMLTELFNAALVGMVPDPVREPPVINVKMDATGGSTVCCVAIRLALGSSGAGLLPLGHAWQAWLPCRGPSKIVQAAQGPHCFTRARGCTADGDA